MHTENAISNEHITNNKTVRNTLAEYGAITDKNYPFVDDNLNQKLEYQSIFMWVIPCITRFKCMVRSR
ncbi:hypothetical protein SPONN_489 [uncultured Candidatus Thioglobus sp.]|nr:hypothetical protein SPONN_489 [uncultured Candidatus Thioglobus sp.]